MTIQTARVLIVDDNEINLRLLARFIEAQGHSAISVSDGIQAMSLLRNSSVSMIDLVLLDVLMPGLNGYEVLQSIKGDPYLRNIPVIIISALDELDSVVRCIELGAEDYLSRPYNPTLLKARINACLEKKFLRDQEMAYLRDVAQVTAAAAAVEIGQFQSASLQFVAQRTDELGHLARILQRMASEVYAREQRLKQQLAQLQHDIEERQRAAAETIMIYLPMDRRQALAHAIDLPIEAYGAALYADISGFTTLTETLARELGPQRGAEEIARQLNRVYHSLIEQVHRYHGSVICFGGDAIICWFDEGQIGKAGLRAVACALTMQTLINSLDALITPQGNSICFAMKIAVAFGEARRFLVGDPEIQQIEALAGPALSDLARVERLAVRGEVLVHSNLVERYPQDIRVATWRSDEKQSLRAAVVVRAIHVEAEPWPALPPELLSHERARFWLPPPVYERIAVGGNSFLSELRSAVVCFMRFDGIDYRNHRLAAIQLDQFIQLVQKTIQQYGGLLLQLTMDDKGSYIFATFGAPTSHEDDVARAISASIELIDCFEELDFITTIGIGLAYGQLCAASYGSSDQRTYGALGDRTNLAARLMQLANGAILCDSEIFRLAPNYVQFEPLATLDIKGRMAPTSVYQILPVNPAQYVISQIDLLSSSQQLTLKIASVIGIVFSLNLLRAIYPVDAEPNQLESDLAALEAGGLVDLRFDAPGKIGHGAFKDLNTHALIYDLLLFAQRRQIHRRIAEWYEQQYNEDLSPHYSLLAHHWQNAEDSERASFYFERAGELARRTGAYPLALSYFQKSLALDSDLRQ